MPVPFLLRALLPAALSLTAPALCSTIPPGLVGTWTGHLSVAVASHGSGLTCLSLPYRVGISLGLTAAGRYQARVGRVLGAGELGGITAGNRVCVAFGLLFCFCFYVFPVACVVGYEARGVFSFFSFFLSFLVSFFFYTG